MIHFPCRHVISPDGKEVKFLEHNGPSFESAVEKGDLKTAALTAERFHKLRNKLAYLVGFVDHVEDKVFLSGESFSSVLRDTQWEKNEDGSVLLRDGEPVLKTSLLDSELVIDGAHSLEHVHNSSYEMISPVPVESLCSRAAERLDQALSKLHAPLFARAGL